METVQAAQSAHLCRESEDVWVVGEIQRVQRREAANAERDAAELVEGDVEVAYGAGDCVEWERGELVVGELEDGEHGGPLGDIRDLLQVVVGEVQLL